MGHWNPSHKTALGSWRDVNMGHDMFSWLSGIVHVAEPRVYVLSCSFRVDALCIFGALLQWWQLIRFATSVCKHTSSVFTKFLAGQHFLQEDQAWTGVLFYEVGKEVCTTPASSALYPCTLSGGSISTMSVHGWALSLGSDCFGWTLGKVSVSQTPQW